MRARKRRSVRGQALAEARRWIGTPYRHQASCLGAGCDCLGLLRGVWRALYDCEPEAVPVYERDVSATPLAGALMAAAHRHFIEIDKRAAGRGDVLLFAAEPAGPARHCAILSGPNRIIHAYWHRSVCETALTPWWRRRMVAAFAFPERSDPSPLEEIIWPSLP